MKKFVLISLLLLGGSGFSESRAQIPPFISDSTTVSVMTMGPSQVELYTAFGHSAFRVLDHKTGIDLVFNYGIFSFNQPNFYLNFARGKLLYKLGVNRYEDFKEAYIEENRSIVEQNLNLTVSEKHQLYAFLVENNKPENRDYYYNYVYDNCATKIRDVLETVFKDRITFDYSYVTEDLTFRQLMDMNLGQQPWGDLGIDICLGTGIDKVATGYQYMYLPEYIQKAFAGATIKRRNSTVPLVSDTEVVFMPIEEGESQASLVTPTIVFVLVFMLVGFSTQQEWKAGKRRKWLDFTLFFVVGVVGILLLFLWFATDHISQYNFNLLWAFPVHAFVAFYAFKNSPPNWLSTYLLSAAVLLALVIVSWSFLPQMLHLALVPIMLTLGLRAIFWRKSAFRTS
ncbi:MULTISPECIES: DUF4105 domain-containing protein [unclassified Imperialibacter]|uniref:lipoprotein N-acyltransferase Lnb domain-containing protein n=1 Tax=unclassified Imperialibacter TaxID=2629706 RepID=UPI00125554F1|nr:MULTISPECIES: DUF4105 domain-containing protein [unclassified Imperialibacter]CAD5271891.1 conserved membrane hypothetical protein [Imperialibacter sp. 89]CAD5299101.1 conserved membrane hypothetical protein [Imperialibacter sp. 75]VVT35141.1 conserved membrane hypothetical protein [Imperialibacter sp. EC-SDR9]